MLLFILIVIFLLAALFSVVRLVGCMRRRHYFSALRHGVRGVVMLALVTILLLLLSGLTLLHNLTTSEPIARLQVHAAQAHHYAVTLEPAAGVAQQYDLQGDEWVLGAKVIVFRPWLQAFGVRNRYQFDFLTSRYDGMHADGPVPVSYTLEYGLPMAFWVYQHVLLAYCIQTTEGSAVYMPLQANTQYIILLGSSGLMANKQ